MPIVFCLGLISFDQAACSKVATAEERIDLPGRFDHGAAKLKGLKSQLRMLRRKKRNFQNLEEDHF